MSCLFLKFIDFFYSRGKMDGQYVTRVAVMGPEQGPTAQEKQQILVPLNNLQLTLQHMPAHIIEFR